MARERTVRIAINVASAMPELLERSGFRLRGKRADCIHCAGGSVATVSYTETVAFCHRCKWTANIITLAKELGLLATDPESKRQRQEEARELAEYRRTIQQFEAWRDAQIRKFSTELRQLGRSAVLATEVLKTYPECEPAWDALARYCHKEGGLSQMLDFLTCTKASPWLSEDYTILDVFEAWREIYEKR